MKIVHMLDYEKAAYAVIDDSRRVRVFVEADEHTKLNVLEHLARFRTKAGHERGRMVRQAILLQRKPFGTEEIFRQTGAWRQTIRRILKEMADAKKIRLVQHGAYGGKNRNLYVVI